jgi:exonuclease III
MTIKENKVTLINIYGPNTDSPQLYERVRNTYFEFNNEYFILCGDFNIVLNTSFNTCNYCGVNNPKARAKILEIMEDLQLLDYYRIHNPDKNIYMA